MAKDQTLVKLEALKALAPQLRTTADGEPLRTFLRDRSNSVVARAATLAGEIAAKSLADALLTACERMFRDPVKSDPQCLAKIALVKALRDLDWEEPAIFFRAARHIQMEPVWGGQVDAAIDLRATSGHALTSCAGARIHDVFLTLVDLLADPAPRARAEAALAIGRLEHEQSELLLRLKIRTGDEAPEVMGACFDALLNAAPGNALPLLEPFLDDDELAFEAAAALGASRLNQAFELLVRRIADGDARAESLLRALLPKRPYPEFRARIAEAVEAHGGGALKRIFAQEFALD